MAEPFLKWVGGKRQLLDVISRKMPRHFSRYYEPFLGGGAVFFRFLPKRAFINDSNQALMNNTYQQIRDNCHLVLSHLSDLDQALSAEFYYFVRSFIRSDFNAHVKRGVYDASLAAEMIFLNKHCFKEPLINSALRLHASAVSSRRPTILSTKRDGAFCRYASGLSPREIQRIHVNPEHLI